MPKPPPPPPPSAVRGGSAHTWADDVLKTYGEDGKTEFDVPIKVRTGGPAPGAPVLRPYYFDHEYVKQIVDSVWPTDGGLSAPILNVGPKGCGKTSIIEQIAARCNIPVHRVNLNVGSSVAHLKGHRGARDGSTIFYPGVATRAMEEGAWLLLDELSGAIPQVALSLFPIFEPDGRVFLEEAEPSRYVNRHPDFRLFATDNVIGADQEQDRWNYSGTNPDMNEALLDRIHTTIQFTYMPKAQEKLAVLAAAPWIVPQVAEMAVTIADKVRANPALPAMSTRSVIEWARRLNGVLLNKELKGDTKKKAVIASASSVILNKYRTKSDKDAVAEIIRRFVAEKTGT